MRPLISHGGKDSYTKYHRFVPSISYLLNRQLLWTRLEAGTGGTEGNEEHIGTQHTPPER